MFYIYIIFFYNIEQTYGNSDKWKRIYGLSKRHGWVTQFQILKW